MRLAQESGRRKQRLLGPAKVLALDSRQMGLKAVNQTQSHITVRSWWKIVSPCPGLLASLRSQGNKMETASRAETQKPIRYPLSTCSSKGLNNDKFPLSPKPAKLACMAFKLESHAISAKFYLKTLIPTTSYVL